MNRGNKQAGGDDGYKIKGNFDKDVDAGKIRYKNNSKCYILEDRMIIDILDQSKKRVYDHYLDYVTSSKSTVFEEDKQKIVDLFTQKSKGPIIFREHQRNSKDYYVKSLDATTIYNSNDEPEIILATASDITPRWHEQHTLKYLLFYTNQDDIVIRMGGDEFVIFVKNIQNDLNYLCKELMNHLDEITLSHNRLRFSMSMGIYAFNTSLTFDEAFKEADEALYHSKRNGRSQFTIKYQS